MVYFSRNVLSRFQTLCHLLLCLVCFTAAHADTLYFDGEDGNVDPWRHYAGDASATLLQNVYDSNSLSRVIQIQGSSLDQGSLLGGLRSDDGWNNTTEFVLSWRMFVESSYLIEIPVNTLFGTRYLIYQAYPPSTVFSGSYLYLSLGSDSLAGQWTAYVQDLSKAVESSEPGNRLLAVHGMIFRGAGSIDDVRLSRADVAKRSAKVVASAKVSSVASDGLIASVKETYKAYSMAELLVLAADADRYANLELSIRLATGSRGAPKSQSAALRQYVLAASRANYADALSPQLPIDKYGVPVIRIDRHASAPQSVVKPTAVLSLTATQGSAPLALTASASNSTTFNGSNLLAWSDNASSSLSSSRFLGSAQSLSLNYSTVGQYNVRLLLMDDHGNIDSANRSVSVHAPSIATPPASIVLQQDVNGAVREVSWSAAAGSDSFDLRLVSSAGVVLDSVLGISLTANCSGATCTFTLPDDWIIDNGASLQLRSHDGSASSGWVTSDLAPIANAGPNRGHVQGDSITVYGGNSIDSDGTIASYQWRKNGALLGQGASTSLQLPLGTHTIELTVTDNSGHVSSDQMQLTVFAPSNLSIGSSEGDVVKILDALQVSQSQINTQMTPVANANGYVYTANIEHGPNGDEDGVTLRTMVRKGSQNASGVWSWQSILVEGRTVYDEWHTAPSIEIDRDGLVHVVYNMHNIPWQYKRTSVPHDIQSFEFHGQYVTQAQINTWKFDNSTTFPSFGYADIPGTQITYPRFEKDPNGELYIAYRFASRPKRSWPERTFGAGLAEYSRADQTWTAIGEPLDVTTADFDFHPDAPLTSTPFAAKTGWTAYHPSIVFDDDAGMGVLMLWRSGTAGASTSKPCFAWSDNKLDFESVEGVPLSLPLQPEDCSNLNFSDSQSFYNLADSEMDSQGNIYITLNPVGSTRILLNYNAATGQWITQEPPSGATEIFVDSDDNLWAIASGPRIYKRTSMTGAWQTIYSETGPNQCYPRASVSSDGSTAFIHTHNCNRQDVTIYGVRLKP